MQAVFDGSKTSYDFIGDVHGHHALLADLLVGLGYEDISGCYKHPEARKAVFVGDLINRGPDSEATLSLVRRMHEEGQALPILGNHEFRIIQEFVRFGKIEDRRIAPHLEWIRSWPLFLDLPDVRAVHAAWHFSSISILKDARLDDDEFVEETWNKNSARRQAVEKILYGLKVSLPQELDMLDRFGIKRIKGRVRWWEPPTNKSFADYLLSPMFPAPADHYPPAQEVREIEPYLFPQPPVFMGHYCLPPNIPKISGQVVCLDGCVTCDKVLWAYRWEGEKKPVENQLLSFPPS